MWVSHSANSNIHMLVWFPGMCLGLGCKAPCSVPGREWLWALVLSLLTFSPPSLPLCRWLPFSLSLQENEIILACCFLEQVKVLTPFAACLATRKFIVFADFHCCLQAISVMSLEVELGSDVHRGSGEPRWPGSSTPLRLVTADLRVVVNYSGVAHLLDKMNHPVFQMKFTSSPQSRGLSLGKIGALSASLHHSHNILTRGINHV